MSPPFQLFTSLRYDPLLLTSPENSRPDLNFTTPSPFYMLTYHRDRMLEAAQHFDFHAVVAALADGPALHASLIKHVREWQTKEGQEDRPLKVRVLFDAEGAMSVDFLPVPEVPLERLYPSSFDPPDSSPEIHPAQQQRQQPQPPKPFTPSPLTGGALHLGPTDSLPSSPNPPNTTPPTWLLTLDTAATPPSAHTSLKTTLRTTYDTSRSRALRVNPASPAHSEVILWNPVKEVTEGTLTSLYFWRGGRWVTPPVGEPGERSKPDESCDEGELRHPFAGRWGHSVRSPKVVAGGQRGTSRRWALGKGFCMEEGVDAGTVKVGEGVWVSNGVRGFGWGVVVGSGKEG